MLKIEDVEEPITEEQLSVRIADETDLMVLQTPDGRVIEGSDLLAPLAGEPFGVMNKQLGNRNSWLNAEFIPRKTFKNTEITYGNCVVAQHFEEAGSIDEIVKAGAHLVDSIFAQFPELLDYPGLRTGVVDHIAEAFAYRIGVVEHVVETELQERNILEIKDKTLEQAGKDEYKDIDFESLSGFYYQIKFENNKGTSNKRIDVSLEDGEYTIEVEE